MNIAIVLLALLGSAALFFAARAAWGARGARTSAPAAASPPLELQGSRGVVVQGEIYTSRFSTTGPRYRRRVVAIEGAHAVLQPLAEDALRGARLLRLTADEILMSLRRVEADEIEERCA